MMTILIVVLFLIVAIPHPSFTSHKSHHDPIDQPTEHRGNVFEWNNGDTQCFDVCVGRNNQVKDGMINVHLVPHTHNDLGWLKTVDQYYYGDGKIVNVSVKQILNNVIDSLLKDGNRTFIYAEAAFLWRFWNDQTGERRKQIRKLIDTKQLQLVGGGWSMNDEAGVHYNGMIDQMTLGMGFIKENFGECALPTVGWQIDPFGHSREHANLLAQMGFTGLFLGRIDYQDWRRRAESHELEMLWKTTDENKTTNYVNSIFTSVLHSWYSPPAKFSFDVMYAPVAESINQLNKKRRIKEFLTSVRSWAKAYKTNNFIIPMGGDFMYTNAERWFENMDKIIKYVNKDQSQSGINVLYSSPACYLKQLDSVVAAGVERWPVKHDDFFPYSSDSMSYWTGYFTSKPSLKLLDIEGNNLLQICKQLIAINDDTSEESEEAVDVLGRAMAILQHHDAVTGTAKHHVTGDYIKNLHSGMNKCLRVISKHFSRMYEFQEGGFKGDGKFEEEKEFTFCPYLNVSQCDVTESSDDSFVVMFYNPLAKSNVIRNVRIPVHIKEEEEEHLGYVVQDISSGQNVECQVVSISEFVISIPGRKSEATHEVVFSFTFSNGLSTKKFNVFRHKGFGHRVTRELDPPLKSYVQLGNSSISVNREGKIRVIEKTKSNNMMIDVEPSFAYYESKSKDRSQSSGAYVFRPSKELATPILVDMTKTRFIKGKIVDEVHLHFTDHTYVSQVIRMYHSSRDELELEWIVGPIDVDDGIGKDIVVQYKSTIESGDEFYTDAWGRQMMRRVRNRRESWNYTVDNVVSANYYPVNSAIYVENVSSDSKHFRRMTVLTDRSEGGSSLRSGEIELMVHRRHLHDDGFGVEEPLNETEFGEGLVVRGKHILQLSTDSSQLASRRQRLRAEALFMNSVVAFKRDSQQKESFLDNESKISPNKKLNLPSNFHLLTFQKFGRNKAGMLQYLIRIEHMFSGHEIDNNDHSVDSMSLNLKELFLDLGFRIDSIIEMDLSGSREKSKVGTSKWNTEQRSENDESVVHFNPTEIKTFIINKS